MAPAEPRADRNGHAEAGHEPSDLDPKNIALFGAGLVIAIVLVLAASYGLFEYNASRRAKERIPPSPLSLTRESIPEPRLQVRPEDDLRAMRAAEEAALNSYGWIDKKAGIVRIPVDRAIDLLTSKGLPARKESERQKSNATGR